MMQNIASVFFISKEFAFVFIIGRCVFNSQVPITLRFPEVGTCAPPRGHDAAKLSLHERESTTVTQTPQSP